MRRIVIVVAIGAVALIGAVAGFAAWLLYTPEGLRWAADQATRLTDGSLRLEQPAGTLAGGSLPVPSRQRCKCAPLAGSAKIARAISAMQDRIDRERIIAAQYRLICPGVQCVRYRAWNTTRARPRRRVLAPRDAGL